MQSGVTFGGFRELSGLTEMDRLEIFNDLQDYLCVHRVELDEFGDVADARLVAWNRSYEQVRTKPVQHDQSMRDTYFQPELALDFVNRAWHDGVAKQVFELTPSTRDRYRPEGAVVYINVLWQRVGDRVVEVGNDLSELRLLQMQLADEESAATAALHARILAEERERIARDLHDSVIQQLFASALLLNAVADTSKNSQCSTATRQVADTLSTVIGEIRRGIIEVRSEVPSSLEAELNDTVQLIARGAGAFFHVTVADGVDCDGEIRSNLRIAVREAATNAVRHGHATQVGVAVAREGFHVVVRVTDDGVGLSAEPGTASGLANLRRRAEQLGGSMSIEAGASGGTVLTWRVPLPVGESQ